MYCVWQVVKTPTIISNNPEFWGFQVTIHEIQAASTASSKTAITWPVSGMFAKIAKCSYQLHHVCLSVHMEQLGSAGQSFMKFDLRVLSENLSRKFKFHWNPKRVTGTLHKDRYTFLIISRWILLEWEMFQTKVVDQIWTHFAFSNFLQMVCRLCGNAEKYRRTGQATDYNMAHAHCTLYN